MAIDWNNLGFSYIRTNGHMSYTWKDGQWGKGTFIESDDITLSAGATALHYGQSAFEGLKAYRGPDEQIRTFRKNQNLLRLNRSATYLMMPEIPAHVFNEGVNQAILNNLEFLPPHESGGAMYIRPLLFGSAPQMGVKPSDEYTLLIMTFPVGDYYKGGIKKGVPAIILEGFDRAAPYGLGHIKAAGNYAASLTPSRIAKEHGFAINLYLDAKENKYIDEFGTSNFIGITKKEQYITPESPSILRSITNSSLIQLAKDNGLNPKRRPIEVEELDNLKECGACGTAVVITPINKIHHKEKVYQTGPDSGFGPVLEKLYNQLRAIQRGDQKDPYNWTEVVVSK